MLCLSLAALPAHAGYWNFSVAYNGTPTHSTSPTGTDPGYTLPTASSQGSLSLPSYTAYTQSANGTGTNTVSATASFSFPLTFTATWVPTGSLTTDPAPTVIRVVESGSVGWNSYGYEVPQADFSSAGSAADDGNHDTPVWNGNGYNMSSCSYVVHQYTVNASSGVATWTRTLSANATGTVTNYASYAYAAVTLSSYWVSSETINAAVKVDQDLQVLPTSATTTRFSATVSNYSGFTIDSIKISVDGQPRVTATIPNGSSQGYIDWNSSSALNPSQHSVSALAQIHDSIGTITLDSRRPEGNNRTAQAIIADVRLQSLKFNNNITLNQDATTPVPTPEFTWTSASNSPATSNPAAYIQGKTVNMTMLLGSSTGAALTGSVPLGYGLKLQANPNTTNPATSQADPTLTLYDNTTSNPFTPTSCSSSTAIAATTALDSWVAPYSLTFSALNLYVQFSVSPSPVWVQIGSYASSGSPFGNTLYATVAAPTAPMANPWTRVLNDACNWATRTSDATSATTALVTSEYNSAHYNGGNRQFTEPFTDTQETFHLSGFLNNSNPYPFYGQCNDFSDFLVCLSNAIGARPLESQRSVSTAEDGAGSHFFTKPITAAPDQNVADAAPRPGGWNYHQWTNDTGIFDACLRFGGVTSPVNMSGPAYGSTYNTDLVATYLHSPLHVPDWDPQSPFMPTIAN